MAVEVAQDDSLDGRVRLVEGGVFLISATARENGPQMLAAEAARFSSEAPLRLANSQLQVVYASEQSLQEKVGQLQWDKIRLFEQSALEARHGGPRLDVLDKALRRVVTCVTTSGSFGLSVIKNLLTLYMWAGD